ncbi:MAG: hypothetical protein QXX30_03200 [Candidatus Aenigmatarchaeota archaeon]
MEPRLASLKLFLSKTCGYCQELEKEYGDIWHLFGFQVFYLKESDSFDEEYEKVKDYFKKNNPELLQYEYVVPVLLIEESEENKMCYIGYPIISKILGDLKSMFIDKGDR